MNIKKLNEKLESVMNDEDWQYYLFSVPANITIAVMADSKESAKDILRQETTIDFIDEPIESYTGDAEIRAIDFDDIDSAIELGE
jgi:hypothetical protein